MARILGKEEIFAASDRPSREVPVPEWGGEEAVVIMLGMTGRQRHIFESMWLNWKEKDRSIDDVRAHVVAWCTVDEDHRRLFNDTSDVKRLSQEKSALVLDRLFDAVLELSGIRKEELEDLEKNSARATLDGSPSDSASPSGNGTSTDS